MIEMTMLATLFSPPEGGESALSPITMIIEVHCPSRLDLHLPCFALPAYVHLLVAPTHATLIVSQLGSYACLQRGISVPLHVCHVDFRVPLWSGNPGLAGVLDCRTYCCRRACLPVYVPMG